MQPTTLPERLRSAREAAGLSQNQVAKMLGYYRPTMSDIEAGNRKVFVAELVQLATIYGVGLYWLATGVPTDPNLESVLTKINQISQADCEKVLALLETFPTIEN